MQMRCIGCGCTNDRACPGGCSWVSLNPPKCSTCIDIGRVKPPSGGDPRDCAASDTGRHQLFWLTARTGFCDACRLPFVATEVA